MRFNVLAETVDVLAETVIRDGTNNMKKYEPD